jgi:hypothetical protein
VGGTAERNRRVSPPKGTQFDRRPLGRLGLFLIYNAYLHAKPPYCPAAAKRRAAADSSHRPGVGMSGPMRFAAIRLASQYCRYERASHGDRVAMKAH